MVGFRKILLGEEVGRRGKENEERQGRQTLFVGSRCRLLIYDFG